MQESTKVKKRLLMITYYWPPSGGSGVQRLLKYAKYLRQYGWEPIVFTAENADYPVVDPSLEADIPAGMQVIKQPIWEPFDLYRKFTGRKKSEQVASIRVEDKNLGFKEKASRFIRGNFFIPDARSFWVKPATKFLVKWLKENQVDAILSSGPPHSVNLIGAKVRQQTNIPLITDWRDPWTEVDYYQKLFLTKWGDNKHRRLQKEILDTSDLVVSAGKGMADAVAQHFEGNVEVIYNGYDPSDEVVDVLPSSKFSLVHIGILGEKRNPEVLWQALAELINEGHPLIKDLEIKLIGGVDRNIIASLDRYQLSSFAVLEDYIPHQQAIVEQRKAWGLLLPIDRYDGANFTVPGKLFEYLMAKRTILVIGPPTGETAQIVKNTHAGVVINYEEVQQAKQAILELHEKFKAGEAAVQSSGVNQFSRPNLTAQLVGLLEKLTHSSSRA